MNKSAPAGNVLRKQISLLPKYKLTMTPVGNDKVSIQLTLLNHAHLTENIDQLSAGETHKCHVVVGDAEKHILLLASFKDKDLIGVYNGSITYEISRKHNYEHKVFVHCISSNFVGLDVQSEYLFKGFKPSLSRGESIAHPIEESTTKKKFIKQTTITDTFKERKRKSSSLDISQSKEKKKRDNAVIEKFRHLKESFGKSSIELRDDLQRSVDISNNILQEITPSNKQVRKTDQENNLELACEDNNDCGTIVKGHDYPEMLAEDLCNEQNFIADEHFDNILSEIENEISKNRHIDGPTNSQKHAIVETTALINKPNPFSKPNYKVLNSKRPTKSTRYNYSFIELLERKANLSDEDDITFNEDGGFSDTIKSQVDNFIMKASTNTTNTVDIDMTKLLSNPSSPKLPDKQVKTVESCIEVLNFQNNKVMEKDTTIILKAPMDLTMVAKERISLKERDLDMTTEYPEVIFDSTSNKDTNQMAIKGAKHKNDLIYENTPYEGNLVNAINQGDNFKNIAGSIKPEMFVDHVNNKGEPAYFSQKLLNSPCDLKKYEKCQNNNLKISSIVLASERNRKFEENGDVEIINGETTHVGEDSREKYIPKTNLPIGLAPSEKIIKQMCANNYCKFSNQLMLPSFNTMSINTSQRNTANLVDNLNQASIVKNNRLEKQPILYFKEAIGGIKPFNETKQNPHHLPYNTTTQVNTHTLPSISEKPLQLRKDENWDNLKSDDDTLMSAISKEISASFPPSTPKKEKYVNTYSFSTTKIDVETKKHADLQVQIIRKLKVDLDITEILTRGDKDVQKNKGKTTQTMNCVDNILSCAHEVPNYSRKCEISDNHEGLWFQSQLAYELNPIDEMCVEEKNVSKIEQNLLQDVNEKELAIVQGQTLEKPQRTEDLKGRLGNILEIYSKILRKNDNLQGHGVTSDENKGTNLTSKLVGQTSRPYKIQDINKLDIDFPMTIIKRTPEVVTPNNDDVIARLKALKQNNRNDSIIKAPKAHANIVQDVQLKITEQVAEDYEDTAMDETLPNISNLETVDFDIDQSMFNPKTVLQCLSKDTGFVPPPFPFSDDINTMHEAFDNPEGIEFEQNNDEYSDTSIFDKNSPAVLTSTKEIETWTLSQDDNEYKSFDLKDSYTVVRINSPINVPQNNRKAKLDKFTYKVKNKLKM